MRVQDYKGKRFPSAANIKPGRARTSAVALIPGSITLAAATASVATATSDPEQTNKTRMTFGRPASFTPAKTDS